MTAEERARLRALIDERRRELCEIPRERVRRPKSRYRKVGEATVEAMRAVYLQLGVATQAQVAKLAGVGSGTATWGTRALLGDGVIRATGRTVRRSPEFEVIPALTNVGGKEGCLRPSRRSLAPLPDGAENGRVTARVAACAVERGSGGLGAGASGAGLLPPLRLCVLPVSRNERNGGAAMPRNPDPAMATASTVIARENIDALNHYARLHGRTQKRELAIAIRIHLLEHGLVALERGQADGTLPSGIDVDADAERIRAELEELRRYAFKTPMNLFAAVG